MFLQLSIQQTGNSSLLFHFSVLTLLLLSKIFLLLWQKLKWQKYPFANVKQFCHLRKLNQSNVTKSMDFYWVCPIQTAKHFYIFKWISFAISNFALIEKMASSQFVSSASEWSIVLDCKECKRKAINVKVLEFVYIQTFIKLLNLVGEN